jgi:glycerol kinase
VSRPAILAIDAGTTGITVLLVGQDGAVLSRGYREFRTYRQAGSSDGGEIWRQPCAAREALTAARVEP